MKLSSLHNNSWFAAGVLLAAMVCFHPVASQGAVLITPVGSGNATGSGATGFGGMFDAQPVGIPPLGATTDPFGASYGFYATATTGYIDFGASYANITLEQTIVGLKQFGSASTIVLTSWWSDTPDATFNGSDIAAPDLGIFSTGGANSNKQWVQTWTGSVTVPKQYLLLQYTAVSQSNRTEELVFVGTVVPEPTSLALLAGAGTVLLGLRRRRA